jgi:RHS repeat-associated protein
VVYDAADRPWKTLDGEGTASYRWYDAYGAPQYAGDGKPAGANDPVLLPGQSPSAPAATWYSETTYDPNTRLPIRTRFWGANGPDSGAPAGWMQVAWTKYDTLRRPYRSLQAVFAGDFVPASAADCTDPEAAGCELGGAALPKSETTYRADGKVESVTDAADRVTNLSYDGFARQYLVESPSFSGHRDSVQTVFDAYGRTEESQRTFFDPNGTSRTEVSKVFYDDFDRVERTEGDPAGADLITTMAYDALSRPEEIVRRWDAAGPWVAGTYHANDRVSKRTYDRVGRLKKTEARSAAPDTWAATEYTYTSDGLMATLEDPENRVTTWTYDGLGRVRKMQYPADQGAQQTVEITSYDGHGKPLVLVHKSDDTAQAATLTWTMTYDAYGRMVDRTASTANLPTGLTFYGTDRQQFEFDDLGRMVLARDLTTGLSDIEVVMRYDTAGRLLEDDQRHPVNGTLVSHKVTSAYDITGFRTGLTYPDLPGGGTGYALTMTRDTLGRLVSISGPSDPDNVGSTPEMLAGYSWMGPRPWDRTQANFTQTRYWDTDAGTEKPLYDPLGRLLGVRTVDQGTGGTILGDFASFRYGYDRVGNLMYEQRLHEPLATADTYRTRAHRTDLLGRLERWREGATTKQADPTAPAITLTPTEPEPDMAVTTPTDGETWALDLVGNWDKKATGTGAIDVAPTDDYSDPNPLHQYTSVTPAGGELKPFSHDFLGQLRRSGRRNHEYTWDLFGRLTTVCSMQGETCSCIATYRYDALNRRVEKVVELGYPASDRITRFYYDGWRAIEERAVEGFAPGQAEIVRARYGFGVGLDEVLWMDRDVPRTNGQPDFGPGEPDNVIESRYFFAHDLLGSVVAATLQRAQPDDELGLVVAERYTYSAYGEVQVWTQGWNGSQYVGERSYSPIGMPYLYTGQRQDPETGLWYFKNRVYDGESGRFLRRDLIGYGDGPNLYRYAGGRPNAAADAMGSFAHSTNPSANSSQFGYDLNWRMSESARGQFWHDLQHRSESGSSRGKDGPMSGMFDPKFRAGLRDGSITDVDSATAYLGRTLTEAEAASIVQYEKELIRREYPDKYPDLAEDVVSLGPDANGRTTTLNGEGLVKVYTPDGSLAYRVMEPVDVPVYAKRVFYPLLRTASDRTGIDGTSQLVIEPARYLWQTFTDESGIHLGIRTGLPLKKGQFVERVIKVLVHELAHKRGVAEGKLNEAACADGIGAEFTTSSSDSILADPVYARTRYDYSRHLYPYGNSSIGSAWAVLHALGIATPYLSEVTP